MKTFAGEHEKLAGRCVDFADVDDIAAVEQYVLACPDDALIDDIARQFEVRPIEVARLREFRTYGNEGAHVDDGFGSDENAVRTGEDDCMVVCGVRRANLAIEMCGEVTAYDIEMRRVGAQQVEDQDVISRLIEPPSPLRFAIFNEGCDRRFTRDGIIDRAVLHGGLVRRIKLIARPPSARR